MGGSLSDSQGSAIITDSDLKFMIALLNYALFSCPVDGGIDMVDGTTASRAMIEDLKKRLENNRQITDSDLQFMNAILDYSLFACSVDSGIDIGDGVTADREMIEALKKRVVEVLASKAQLATEPAAPISEPLISDSVSEAKRGAQIADSDLKALIAILDYSLFTVPDEGIDIKDGSKANKETIENLKRQLEGMLASNIASLRLVLLSVSSAADAPWKESRRIPSSSTWRA
jgi:hypothetical protein